MKLSCGEKCGLLFGQLNKNNVIIENIQFKNSNIDFSSTTNNSDSGVLGGVAYVYKKFELSDVALHGVIMRMMQNATACFG